MSRGNVASLRIGQLRRLLNRRWGAVLPPDDAGRGDVAVMLDHMVQRSDRPFEIDNFLDAQAPWMPQEEREAAKQAAATGGARWSADALGQHLRLTMAERSELKITTIAPCDVDRERRVEIQKEKHRERERLRRRREAVRIVKRRRRFTDRDWTVFEHLDPRGWHALSTLQSLLVGHKEFVGVDDGSMRKLINRSLKKLEGEGLVKTENRSGFRGLPVLFATRDLSATHAQLSPGTLTGTTCRA